MQKTLITNARIIMLDRVLEDHALLLSDGKIQHVFPVSNISSFTADEHIDGNGGFLVPGFIDLHIHGLRHHRVDFGIDHLKAMCADLPMYGVTGFLPTVVPRPKGEDAEFLSRLAHERCKGAEILGFHLEGPFLTLPGAMSPRSLGTADPERVWALVEAASPHRVIFSVAPDFPGILDLLPIMARNGTPVFATHTRASVSETNAAIDAGVSHATHFYNVFPSPPEKEPGVHPCGSVEAILSSPRVTVDVILDGEHVDPTSVKVALACKGPGSVCLATDSNIGAGLPPGRYRTFAGYCVEFKYEGGPARMAADAPIPGGLAGSGLTLDRAVRNATRMLGVDLSVATRMASASPAGVLGLEDRKGRIEAGFDADLVLLNRELRVVRTWVGGECVFAAA